MCGICGYLEKNEIGDSETVHKMAETLHHRGPDYTGASTMHNAAFGHARLSIIDLSKAGNQPFFNEDKSLMLVCNGEIYNFHELREHLLEKGHRFISSSDSETIIHLYEEYGEQCAEKLHGMFAFALYDAKINKLLLCRDRIGKKPLFYSILPSGTLVFGSEIKAIQAYPEFKAEPDMVAIHYYLSFQSVPAPWCAFKGVKKLPPAHCLTFQHGTVTLHRYWSYDYNNQFKINSKNDEIELQEALIEQLKTAIRKRMVSDVPIGAFLSGGLDSSLVTALMATMCDQPIRTFSIGFEEKDHDETAYAKMVAERYGTRHTVFEVKPKLLDIIDKLVYHYNEPFADSSAIPTFYLAQMASEHVKVVLTGDAGDENFAGYSRYINGIPQNKFWGYSTWVSRYLNFCRFNVFNHPGEAWSSKLKRQFRLDSYKNMYFFRITHFNEQYQRSMYKPEMYQAIGNHYSIDFFLDKYDQFHSGGSLDRTLGVDMTMYMPDTLMVKTDIATMAHALEARCPMLDHQFVEFAAKIPANLKLKDNSIGKYILKRAAEKYLPHDVIYRKKMGFGVPYNHWLRSDKKIHNFTYDTILEKDNFLSQWLNMKYVRQMLERQQNNLNKNYQNLIWNLLMLELWHKRFIKNGGVQ
ncbi:MAG: asparagine synthase (glutamine-hydrolyzing) [Victivallaceae bacterium]|nr:asparagine synthase (glutamine-hydrolyzing) [Victivallaceae bacterium]